MRPLLPTLVLLVGCGEYGLGMAAVADGAPLVAIAPDGQIRFEQASPNGRSQHQEITIGSDGDVPAYIADVWIESETGGTFYTNEELPFPKLMDPGESIPITVRFLPPMAGTFHGTLVIESGVDGTLLERQLLGEGCRDSDQDGRC